MARASLAVCALILTTTTAYNEHYFWNFHNPSFTSSQHRRMDSGQGSADGYEPQTDARATNDRSITYRTDGQGVQPKWERIRAEEMQARNGNATYKFGNNIVPSIGTRSGGTREPDSAVIFPGPTNRNTMFVPEIPQECEEFGICEKVPNYPYDYMENLIRETNALKYFNMDMLTPEITQRGGPGQEVLCASKEEIVYPEAARNVDGKWVYIVNRKGERVQGFRVEICMAPEKQCNSLVYVDEKYKLECGQKSTHRAMWSVNATGYMVMEIVSTPSCCSCVIKNKT